MDIIEARKILRITPRDMCNARDMLVNCNGYWSFGNHAKEPHALLTSKKHSDAYYNVPVVTQFSNLRKLLAEQIVMKLVFSGIKKIDVVVSSSYAAFTIGQSVADMLGAISFYTEKIDGKQAWTGRFDIPEGAEILEVEELITTIGTTANVSECVMKSCPSGASLIKYNDKILVATIVHRPAKLPGEYPNHNVIALHEEAVHNWDQGDCPLCKIGSKALKPKENWELFMSFMK